MTLQRRTRKVPRRSASPVPSSSGVASRSVDAVVRRPRRQPRRRWHAVALHQTQNQHDRRQRHQPDRLYVATRQRRHLERRRRRASLQVDRRTCRPGRSTARAPRARLCHRRRSDLVPARHHASRSVGFVAGQPGLGPCEHGGARPPERGDLLRRTGGRSGLCGSAGCVNGTGRFTSGTTLCGYPDDKWGWAVLAAPRSSLTC